jgi:hypothetical protein
MRGYVFEVYESLYKYKDVRSYSKRPNARCRRLFQVTAGMGFNSKK